MLRAKMRRRCPRGENLRVVVVTPFTQVAIKVKDLLAAVGGDRRIETSSQTMPGLSVLLPGIEDFGLDAVVGEEEGTAQIVPDRVAREVEQIEWIPPQGAAQRAKERAWGAAALQLATVGFEPHPIRGEDTALARFWVVLEDRLGLGDKDLDVALTMAHGGFEPGGEGQATEREPGGQGGLRAPLVEPAVTLQNLIE